MKTALIPPIPDLDRYGQGDFHLLLAHLLQDKRYFNHYLAQRDKGAYLVLDNSAHEDGEGTDAEALLFNAMALKAQEVVVPDVLDDGPATVERSTEALETWFEGTSTVNRRLIHQLSPALMYVPQGRNETEWRECLDDLIRMHLYVARKYEYRPNFVIGLSKDYEVWDGGLLNLLDDHLGPLAKQFKAKVHLLGWGRKSWALDEIARKHPWIRSTDSAKPFVFARKGINLWHHLEEVPPKYPGRPKSYFHRSIGAAAFEIADANVDLFHRLANGIAS